jgi:hypothetical protein
MILIFIVILAGNVRGSSVPDPDSATFEKQFYQGITYLKAYVENTEKTLNIMNQDRVLFNRERVRDFTLHEKKRLYGLWGHFLDHLIALEDLNSYYRHFYLLKSMELHQKAFLMAYASYISKFSFGLAFISRTIDNDLYEKKLDDLNQEYGIPPGMYARLKWNTIHIKDVTNILAGYQYYRFLKKAFKNQGLMDNKKTAWIFNHIEINYAYIKEELKLKGVTYFLSNGLDILKDKTFEAWFPVQMGVSRVMADIKFKRLHEYLISNDQIMHMDASLQPGDIIVSRRNWYLSNVGLPGFWPHAELYTGTYGEIKEFFSDESVTAYYRSQGRYDNFMDYLLKNYPEKMKKFIVNAPDGHPVQIIEAVGDGVKFSSLQEGTLSDYIGVMRPRLSRLDIAKAIDEAFRYLNRPYDFNFDFLTDSTLVCSELIYKVYLNDKNKKGLHLPLKELAGRKIVSPNDIVKKFAVELDTPEQELDFVYFLDGSEKDNKAFVKGLDAFRQSHRRLKWDIVQQ